MCTMCPKVRQSCKYLIEMLIYYSDLFFGILITIINNFLQPNKEQRLKSKKGIPSMCTTATVDSFKSWSKITSVTFTSLSCWINL